ncbi:CCA tRNA nucleotidyltransferase [Pelistega europaea]|uniref:CCA tRNA nucleotidyltransferase n=1 Tax=Pelistega europaea TaxID=106147 RepID=A0A7Y4P5W9_9BURK|nr:CCA tRNA nucleotidyltransferase [Pelistega europaea]NOL49304.1 CCA tRNA nucleotidyltransferase [Pelistega europaea]
MTLLSTLASLVGDNDNCTCGLQVYCVGGAVRDALLGLPAGDRDWVVVGSTPEEMVSRGFTPVGGDFPVFLHPKTREEYALARTERKSGRGYQGFTFYTGVDVSLEEDLRRRDFTINAMAVDAQGRLHDPYKGLVDLQTRVFRHVSEAFIEDPVRILRLGRFLSRFTLFQVAEETLFLCCQMVSNHEVDALVPERVWKEISRALMCAKPSRFFKFLDSIGALDRVLPGVGEEVSDYLDNADVSTLDLSQRYALMAYASTGGDVDKIKTLSQHLHVSREQADYAYYLPVVVDMLPALNLPNKSSLPLSDSQAENIVVFIEKLDGIRKPGRLLALIKVAKLLLKIPDMAYMQCWHDRLDAINDISTGDIAKQYAPDTQAIKVAIHQARVDRLIRLVHD